MISQVVIAMTRYLALAEDLETMDCFLECQEMRESPKKMRKPVTDLWVSEHLAQSESQNPLSCMGFVEEKNKPCPEVPLRYCRT